MRDTQKGQICRKTLFFERRSDPRFHAKIAALCVNPANSRVYLAKTHDLSVHGLRLIVSEGIALGTLLNICLNMPDNAEQINIKGKVVWSKKTNDDYSMVGIHFTQAAIKPVPIVLRSILASL
jgi:Tfp pilus assembly protein PilZ